MNMSNQDESDILQVEGIYSKGYGLAPKLVMQDPRLSAIGKAIYCYFCSYAGAGRIAFPKISKIMSDLRINKDTFYAHFKPLKAYGFIKVEQTRIGGKHSHNIYTLMDHVSICTKPESLGKPPFSPCPKIPDTVISDTVLPDTVSSDTIKPDTNNNSYQKNNKSKNNRIEKYPLCPPQAVDWRAEENNVETSLIKTGKYAVTENSAEPQIQSSENLMLKTGGGEDMSSSSHSKTLIDERFEEFWSVYPRKVGKSAVYKAWKRLRPDAALFSRILAAIDNAKATEQWQREAGRFIPYPLTWLNQGRWDDDYTPAASQTLSRDTRNNGNALTRLMAKIEAEELSKENEVWGDET